MLVRCSILLLCAVSACTDVSAPSGGGSTTTTSLVITPGQVRLVAVGDTARLRAAMYDDGGTRLTNAGVTWSSADPDVFTIDQSGLVTGLKA
ncbi:MAG TPA: Ig-like domain-containing protein, partial [Gemmatimonadaceae bacterium]|nr:Ig-like domain-containing protein [Gemmatimonadaceae bacterium]